MSRSIRIILVLIILILGALSMGQGAAQEETAEPQQTPISVSGSTPSNIVAGNAGTLSVTGENFTAETTVKLVNFGALTITSANPTTLTAELPASIPAGSYTVEVSDPVGGLANSPNALQVVEPPIIVSGTEPASITAGQEGTLTILGQNFTAQTTVRLQDFGLLETTFVNSGALTAKLPATILARTNPYVIVVSDPVRGPDTSGQTFSLRVIAPVQPVPTNPPIATLEPATPIPGQPSLVIRSFSTNPSTVTPGGTVVLTFEVLNQGNRTAEGVTASVDASSKFVPASGQASATLPNLTPGAATVVTLTVITAEDATAGPTTIPITMEYRDFSGQNYTGKGSLTVTVRTVEEASQVTLARYMVEPNPVIPGERVDVTVLITNTGNQTASQVLLRVGGEGGVLLAGPQGDSFPMGNIEPGASASLELPLIVSTGAKSGPQPQPVTITYLQDGQSQQVTSSMTISVASINLPEPLLILSAYDFGKESVQPGEQFTVELTLQNVGNAPANELLVTFGTVESNDSGGGSGTPTGSSSSTTPSNTFAPLGSGGTVYVGDVAADGGEAAISQQFIVNGTVQSGIYSLPITLQYQKPDGASVTNSLRASVVVIVPPKLQINLQGLIPETVNVGEPFSIGLDLSNTGNAEVELTAANVEAENAEVMEGAEVKLLALKSDEDTSVSGLVMPMEEGPVKVTVTIHYLDDLNNARTIVNTYETQAIVPFIPTEDPNFQPPIFEPTPEPEADNGDLLGQILLGFLGLGS